MRNVSEIDVQQVDARVYRDYMRHFVQESRSLARTMRAMGLSLEPESAAARREGRVASLLASLEELGARVRNDGKSIVWGALSPACCRCRTGVRSVSTFISLGCTRSCWFCFNSNQCDWDDYRSQRKDWHAELDAYKKQMGTLDCIALTGGEPLLFADEALDFFASARRGSPDAHMRMYTSGDGLTRELLRQLADAGLDEIRFSVKLDDPEEEQQAVRDMIEASVGVIPSVMVEMPVVPGMHDQMSELLEWLDRIGVFGVNLLELCFPLHNVQAYASRGLQLKRNPYRILYDYGYAGALPVAGSEELALHLMVEQIERGDTMGLHYCSLENKNTAQLFAQNKEGRLKVPHYRFSSRTFFFETVRAFGDDARVLEELLNAVSERTISSALGADKATTQGGQRAREGAPEPSDVSDQHGRKTVEGVADLPRELYAMDQTGDMIMFDPALLNVLGNAGEDLRLFLASAVIDRDEQGRERFREVGLQAMDSADFSRVSNYCNAADLDPSFSVVAQGPSNGEVADDGPSAYATGAKGRTCV